MGREAELNRIENILQDLAYLIQPETASDPLADVTLLLAEGEANLGEFIAAAVSKEFEPPDDMISGLHNTLPRAAVGEPDQSAGGG